MGMNRKQGNWVPYELKPRDVERRFFACEQLLQRQKRKGFLFRFVAGDEKWIHYENLKRRKSWGMPGHASTSTARSNIHGAKVMLCIWWNQLLKPSETIIGDRYRKQLKVILQHNNARRHVARPVKTYLETLKWEVVPHPPYSPDVVPSDYHLFRQSLVH